MCVCVCVCGASTAVPQVVSTSGVVPRIERLGEDLGVGLAISLHAVTDELRDVLVPANRRWPIRELLQACSKCDSTGLRRRRRPRRRCCASCAPAAPQLALLFLLTRGGQLLWLHARVWGGARGMNSVSQRCASGVGHAVGLSSAAAHVAPQKPSGRYPTRSGTRRITFEYHPRCVQIDLSRC
eukprot:COSAG01_NODE_95_length_26957_cov_48.328617_25_plen_183_part_00